MLKRILFFAYGVASYLVFLATFLYAIAFVGGFVVPTRLDGAATTSLPRAIAIDCALLTLFAVQHSVMARRWFKERWTQIVPWAIERSTYVLCASLALLLLFWQWRPIGIQIWSVGNLSMDAVCRGLGNGIGRDFSYQPFRPVRPASGLVTPGWKAVHASVLSHSIALSVRPTSTLFWLPARVLDDTNDDAGTPTVRLRNNRLYHSCDSVRGTRPCV
jgi:hypothetical protein